MGNRQTTLEIDQFFDQPNNYQVNKKTAHFIINDFKHNLYFNKDGTISVYNGVLSDTEIIQARLDSHMRDFEVVIDGPKIARGQGIGVIIDFSRNLYLKFWKDKNKEMGYNFYFTRFSTEDPKEARHILSSDLGLGYDVFIVDYQGKQHRLCEEKDSSDSKPTQIIFPHLNQYASYDSSNEHESDDESSSDTKNEDD